MTTFNLSPNSVANFLSVSLLWDTMLRIESRYIASKTVAFFRCPFPLVNKSKNSENPLPMFGVVWS